jgi:hypothetical protein
MNQINKEKLKCIILERIKRIQAQKNPEDSKYPLTLTADTYPTLPKHLNLGHKSAKQNLRFMAKSDRNALTKTITFQGDYAKQGNIKNKTLRLKINKSDWPDEWRFPSSEMERRLFLQNFRLSNLLMLTPYDEGGEKYKDLFPPEPESPIEIVFEDEESSDSFEEEIMPRQELSSQSNEDLILEALEALDYLAGEAREYGEPDFAASISEVYMILLREALKNKNKR